MKLLDISVVCIAFLLIPVIKASNKYTEDSGSQRTIIGITAICYDPKDVCNELKPCKNGATCSLNDEDQQPYKCNCVLGYGGVNCEKKLLKLDVEGIEHYKAVLLVMTTDHSYLWESYYIELTNRTTMKSTVFRRLSQSGGVTKIDLPPLEPYTSYSVRVRPAMSLNRIGKWVDEISFKTLGIPPSLTKIPESAIFLTTGENTTIECNASGVPKPTVEWTGSMLPLPQGRSQQRDGRLNISDAQIQDSGNYTCKISNNFGVIQTVTRLTVGQGRSCEEIAGKGGEDDGLYKLTANGATFMVYCDMTNDNTGWTLIARFSNNDTKNWMKNSGEYWYDQIFAVGETTNPADNTDMISPAFWSVKATEFKITRSDDSNHTALLHTTGECLGGQTFRYKMTSYGNFTNSKVWASNECLGSCDVQYGGQVKNIEGFGGAECDGPIQQRNKIGFWCDYHVEYGSGAVLTIGGAGSDCRGADHGIAITEADEASFAHDQHSSLNAAENEFDFGDSAWRESILLPYSLNIWVH